MEVIEFEPGEVMRVRTEEGPMTFTGWASFSDAGENQTKLTLGADVPGMDETMAEMTRPLMERSASTIKALIEAET